MLDEEGRGRTDAAGRRGDGWPWWCLKVIPFAGLAVDLRNLPSWLGHARRDRHAAEDLSRDG